MRSGSGSLNTSEAVTEASASAMALTLTAVVLPPLIVHVMLVRVLVHPGLLVQTRTT